MYILLDRQKKFFKLKHDISTFHIRKDIVHVITFALRDSDYLVILLSI